MHCLRTITQPFLMKFRISHCYNIQNTNKPYLFSLIQTQIKIVRKICFITYTLIQRLKDQSKKSLSWYFVDVYIINNTIRYNNLFNNVIVWEHKSSFKIRIERAEYILHVRLWILILIFSCSSRYLTSERSGRERVRYRLSTLEDKIRIHVRACNILYHCKVPFFFSKNLMRGTRNRQLRFRKISQSHTTHLFWEYVHTTVYRGRELRLKPL